jgi:nitrite reductase/ring-hydroxylating ferredoxin subunit
MTTASEGQELTRVGPGTIMGDLMRCYWIPAALSSELARDGAPVRLMLLGEKLIAFRDSAGRVGVMDHRCPHRCASLFLGRNEEGGLRCIYHGWKYDVEGRCIEMPNVPAGAAYHGKVSIKAYPTREFGEMVWAYLGPRERAPAELPQLEVGILPAAQRYVSKRLQMCNWAQSMEGALDTAHFSFLHMPAPSVSNYANPATAADESRLRWLRDDPMPHFTVLEHEVGFVVGGARRADGDQSYWRATQFMLPSHVVAPSAMPGEFFQGYTWAPVHDEACWIYTYAWHPDRPLSAEERARFEKGGYGQFAELGPGYVPLRNRSNDYLIDREEQKHRSFTGVRGVAEQDALAQDSQGLIMDRTHEHLTPTDVAVVRFRRTMLEAARALGQGVEPEAPRRAAGYRVRGGGALAPARLSLEEMMRQRFGSATGKVEG